jgi:hypothetical protein
MGMKFSLRHARSGAGYLLPAALCVLTVAACGSAPHTDPSDPTPKVQLTVVVKASPGATPKRWTLTCEPAGGTHPDPAAACRQLLAAKNPFAPIPRGIMCPMIAAGPQRATVTGIFLGRPVAMTFARTGCEAAKWSELGDVFGFRAGSGGGGAESGSPVH